MKPSIFVVEDDPDISRLVRHHLEADGFAVKVFSTGNTVISESERQRPALFILDIMVPGKRRTGAVPPDPADSGPGCHSGDLSDGKER